MNIDLTDNYEAIIDAKAEYEAYIASLPENIRWEIRGHAFANSFAVEVHDQYADDLERWEAALATALMYDENGEIS